MAERLSPLSPEAPSRATLASRRRRVGAVAALALVGPGLMVMLADTDAGSVVTAAQSGATFRYAMVLPELLLIPVLYLIQEMTVRLGLTTQLGHGALIRATFGARWALLSAGTLFVACMGALITEFAGVAGVGTLVELPVWLSTGAAATGLITLILLGRYRRVEHIGLCVGALELLFLPAAFLAHPHVSAVVHDFVHHVHSNSSFVTLFAANVGAVIMPWMIFYQQEAVIDKGLRGLNVRRAMRSARLDTASGSVVTQVIMVSIVVASGATLGLADHGHTLNSIGQIASSLTPFLGHRNAVIFFGLGMIGASVVAALVVTLAGAWGVSEVLGWRHSLNDSPFRAVGFYALAVAGIVGGAVTVMLAPNLVNLSVDVEVMNACLLPIVVGFLLALEHRALPIEYRMHGARRAITYALTLLVIGFGLLTTLMTLVRVLK